MNIVRWSKSSHRSLRFGLFLFKIEVFLLFGAHVDLVGHHEGPQLRLDQLLPRRHMQTRQWQAHSSTPSPRSFPGQGPEKKRNESVAALPLLDQRFEHSELGTEYQETTEHTVLPRPSLTSKDSPSSAKDFRKWEPWHCRSWSVRGH